MNIWRALKDLVRGVLGDGGDDMTRTYRPVRDWSVPLDQVLEQLPPEALDPPSVRRRRLSRGGRAPKSKRRYSSSGGKVKVPITNRGKEV